VLQMVAAAGILAGNQAARWTGVALIALNSIGQMLFTPSYPFWSLMIIALDVVALWGCAPTAAGRTSPPEPPAAPPDRFHRRTSGAAGQRTAAPVAASAPKRDS